MPQKLRLDADFDFTLTADFNSNELVYGRSNDLTTFLLRARTLRDTKPEIKRIDLSILGNDTLRIVISGVQVKWNVDYLMGLEGDLELKAGDLAEWDTDDIPFVEVVVDSLLGLVATHLLTDLKYLIT